MNIEEMLEKLKDNIPVEEYRSEGTDDNLTHYEEDKDSWQYKLYNYITNLQEKNIQTLEKYGEVDYLTDGYKIGLIKNKFKSATIDGSALSNELRILNEKYGMYQNMKNHWQLCEIEKIKENEWGEYYKTKHIEELTLNKLFDIIKNEDMKKYYEEKLKEYYDNHRFYYEIDINKEYSYKEIKDYIHLYIELFDNWLEIVIESNRNITIKSRDFELSNKYFDLKDGLNELINKEIIKYADKNIVKLENGYIYKNNYYEDFETLKEFIENEDFENKGEQK